MKYNVILVAYETLEVNGANESDAETLALDKIKEKYPQLYWEVLDIDNGLDYD